MACVEEQKIRFGFNFFGSPKTVLFCCKQHFLLVFCVKIYILRDYWALRSIVKLKYESEI